MEQKSGKNVICDQTVFKKTRLMDLVLSFNDSLTRAIVCFLYIHLAALHTSITPVFVSRRGIIHPSYSDQIRRVISSSLLGVNTRLHFAFCLARIP